MSLQHADLRTVAAGSRRFKPTNILHDIKLNMDVSDKQIYRHCEASMPEACATHQYLKIESKTTGTIATKMCEASSCRKQEQYVIDGPRPPSCRWCMNYSR